MNSEVIIEVIDRLVGSIEPYGSARIDEERLKNLETLFKVMDKYINEIEKVAKYRNRHDDSVVTMADRVADRAYDWLVGLRDYTDEIECVKTVDAIPVEWIQQWWDTHYMYADVEVGDLLNDWIAERKKE